MPREERRIASGIPGKEKFLDYEPWRRKKLLAGGTKESHFLRHWQEIKISQLSLRSKRSASPSRGGRRGPPLHNLDRDDFSSGDFVLQCRGELVDVGGGDIDGHAFEHGHAAAADNVPTNLD